MKLVPYSRMLREGWTWSQNCRNGERAERLIEKLTLEHKDAYEYIIGGPKPAPGLPTEVCAVYYRPQGGKAVMVMPGAPSLPSFTPPDKQDEWDTYRPKVAA